VIRFSTFIHKWTGLLSAIFLIVAGITGSLLAFEDELEALVNPAQYVVRGPLDERGQPAAMLDPFDLVARAERALPGYRLFGLPLLRQPDRSVKVNLERRDATLPDADQAFFDPYDGRLLGVRKWGASPFDSTTLIGFVYRLHYALALPEPWGKTFFGVVALLWTINCLVGIVTTFPRTAPFLRRWLPAWTIKRNASTYRQHFDIHRATGLWLWAVMFLFAWSSVMLNLRSEVYTPVMSSFLDFKQQPKRPPKTPDRPMLAWRDAYGIAVATMEEVARTQGFTVNFPSHLFYNRQFDAFIYYANTSRDVTRERGQTGVFIDARSGVLLTTRIPTGEYSGDTVSRWLQSLHMAKVGGLPYRIFVAVIGLALAISAYTGLYIWWKKRGIRRAREAKIAAKGATAAKSDDGVNAVVRRSA
jgi:uncharacterized iron-regulated membrane protein